MRPTGSPRSRLAPALACAVLAAFAATAGASVIVPQTSAPKPAASNVESDGSGPEIAFDGTRFLLVWTNGATVFGTFLDTGGDVVSPGTITIAASDGWRPSVSYDGTSYLVAWRSSAGDIQAKRVSAAGTVIDADPIVVVTGDVKQRRIGLAFDGTRHLAVWRTEGDQIRGARISTAGVPLDGSSGFSIGDGFYPAVESAAGKFLVAWHAWGTSGNLDVVGSIVTNGTPSAPFTIADDAQDQDHVSVASSGTDYMVAFKDRRYGDEYNFSGTSAVRVTGSGTVLDDPPIKVSDHEWSQGALPTVAWDGTDWVVAWPEDKGPIKHRVIDTYLRRVSTAGAWVDVDPVPVGTGYFHQLDPTLAVAGDRYLAILGDRGACTYPVACFNVWLLARVAGTPSQPPAAGAPHAELGTWQSVSVPTDEAVHGVWGISDDLAFAAAEESGGPPYDQNPLLRWNGTAWSVAARQPNARKWDVWAANGSRVFTAGGAGGGVDYFNGTTSVVGGNLFTPTGALFGQAMAVRGFGAWNTFLAGMDGGVARYPGADQDKWVNGACLTLDGQPYVDYGLWDCDYVQRSLANWDLGGSYPDDVLMVGEHGKLAHFDGSAWSLVAVPTRQSLNGVWESCTGDAFAVGDAGTILRRQGGVWTRMGSPTTEHLTAVAGFSVTDVYAVGYGGTILHFDGASWSPEASGTGNTLEDVGIGGQTVWAVGARQDEWSGIGPGTILRKQRTVTDLAAPKNPQLRSRNHQPGEWTSSSSLSVEFEGGCDDGRGIDGYSVVLDHESNTMPPAVENVDRDATGFTQTVADGEWWLHLRTVDRAGNWSAPAHIGPLRADVTPPSDPSVTTVPATGVWSNATQAQVTWTGAADPASGVAGFSYSIDDQSGQVADMTLDANASATAATLPLGQPMRFVHMRTRDNAGNWSAGVTVGPMLIDWVPPENAQANSPSHSPGLPSTDSTIDVALSGATDAESGVTGFSVAFDHDPSLQPDEVADLAPETTAVTSGALDPGDWWFHVRTVDAAGNWSGHRGIGPFKIVAPSAPAPPSPPPPAPGPLPPVFPPDTTPPETSLAGATRQQLGDTVRVELRCTGREDCLAAATGKLSVRGSSKVYRLTPASRTVPAATRAVLRLRVPRKARTAALRALRSGRRVTVVVTVAVRDVKGNRRTLSRRISLRR